MKNKTTKTDEETAGKAASDKPKIESLPKMEMYAVLGLELGKTIFEKLEAIEASLEVFAHQKKRELEAEQVADAKK